MPRLLELPPNYSLSGRNIESSQTLNERGEFIGAIETNFFPTAGFIFRGGAFHSLRPLIEDQFTRFTFPYGMNDQGDVVGTTAADNPRAVIWPRDGTGPFNLGVAQVGGNSSNAHSISNNGLIAGTSSTGSIPRRTSSAPGQRSGAGARESPAPHPP